MHYHITLSCGVSFWGIFHKGIMIRSVVEAKIQRDIYANLQKTQTTAFFIETTVSFKSRVLLFESMTSRTQVKKGEATGLDST